MTPRRFDRLSGSCRNADDRARLRADGQHAHLAVDLGRADDRPAESLNLSGSLLGREIYHRPVISISQMAERVHSPAVAVQLKMSVSAGSLGITRVTRIGHVLTTCH